jgi:H/ACA ribonucleoprotein complex subunit 4
MHELRRSRTGPFHVETCCTLHDLNDAWFYFQENADELPIRKIIKPIEVICANMPLIYIRDSAVDAICHGASLTIPGVVKFTKDIDKNVIIAILTMKGELVGYAKGLMTSKKISELKNGICASPIAVFMEKETYPSSWKSL